MSKIYITHQLTWQGFQFQNLLNEQGEDTASEDKIRRDFFTSILFSFLIVILLATSLHYIDTALQNKYHNQLDISVPIERQTALV